MGTEGAEASVVDGSGSVPIFGARRKARELASEVAELRAQLDRLGGLTIIELETRRDELAAEIAAQGKQIEREKSEAAVALEEQAAEAGAALKAELEAAAEEKASLDEQLVSLRKEVVVTEETALLQEAGVYEYHHPLDDSVEYQEALKALRADVARERLGKVAATVERLGRTMDIRISAAYHRLRERELALTADYRQKLADEKELEREERERLREEKKAQQEMERERTRLEKERQHYLNTLEALRAKGDQEAAARHEAELEKIQRAIEDVDYRAANIRAGYVYVISNIGSFGEGVVKIGLTRRLDPEVRVRELGDASVPFRFDTHALLFSKDAVGIETSLHERLADRRVNRINARREFFYASPEEVKSHLLDVAGELLSFEDEPEALEFRQSQNIASEETSGDVRQAP